MKVALLVILMSVASLVCAYGKSPTIPKSGEYTVVGYAWPRHDLRIPDTAPRGFKPVLFGELFPIIEVVETNRTVPAYTVSTSHDLGEETSYRHVLGDQPTTVIAPFRGYLVICCAEDGTSKKIGILPCRDRLGNAAVIQNGTDVEISSGFLEAEPGYYPFWNDQRYPVITQNNHILGILFTFGSFTQTVNVSESDVRFVSLDEYNKSLETIVHKLKTMADQALREGHFSDVRSIFTTYNGDFARDSADMRAALADEYESRARELANAQADEARRRAEVQAKAAQERARAAQGQYEAEQRAKGFVRYENEWISPQELQKREVASRRSTLTLRYAKSCSFIRRATALRDRYKGFDRESLEKLLDVESRYKVAYEGNTGGDISLDAVEQFGAAADKLWTTVYTTKPLCGYAYSKLFDADVVMPIAFGVVENADFYLQIGDGEGKTTATVSPRTLREIADGLRRSEDWADERSLVLLRTPGAGSSPLQTSQVIGDWESIHLEYAYQANGFECCVLLSVHGSPVVKLNMLNVHCLLARMDTARPSSSRYTQ